MSTDVFKTVEIGTFENMGELRGALEKSDVKTSALADGLLKKTHLSECKKSLGLMVSTVKDLGFPDGAALRDIVKAGGDRGWDLCPAEVAPQYLIQKSSDLKPGDFLIFATWPIKDFEGNLCLFNVQHNGDAPRLNALYSLPDDFWGASRRFVFVRRK